MTLQNDIVAMEEQLCHPVQVQVSTKHSSSEMETNQDIWVSEYKKQSTMSIKRYLTQSWVRLTQVLGSWIKHLLLWMVLLTNQNSEQMRSWE